ncbi:MAG TPA: hypothetical protein GX505_01890 [Clostridiales bacterium]|nr:hypothetical protein [Clostridiales bacterium]
MLKISIFELFWAVIPEAFIFIFGVYIMTNKPFEYKRIMVSGLAAGIATYLIRLLPLFPGANMFFVILISTALLVAVNKIYIIQAISSFLTLVVVRIATEWLNLFVLFELLHIKLDPNIDPVHKTLLFIPSMILFLLIVVAIYFIKRRRSKKISNVSD